MSLGIHVFARSAGMIEQDSATVPALRDGLPGLEPGTQVQILLSILGVALIFLVRRALLGWVRKGVDDTALQYRWTKISRYVALVLALVVLVLVWFTAIRSLGTLLGLLSAGLAIALEDLVDRWLPINYGTLTPAVYTSVADAGVLFAYPTRRVLLDGPE